ncbi:hypothetical protein V5799_025539 [Amblyomma americanum]|uniref:Uncharacterized protein n=1 Tax=Amblyomma americanum TaxID=6943 RepID=A0AAQ4E989_AMBAM
MPSRENFENVTLRITGHHESDLLVGPVAPTYDRASALEPLPQFFYAEAIHCGGLTDPYITNVFGYVNSFDVENSGDIYQRMIWAKANRLGGIMPVREVFTKRIFDDVLQTKKVVFLEETLLYTALERLYSKESPKGQFYKGAEITMNLTMGMWVNRHFPSDLRNALHKRTRWIIESGLPEWYRLSILERAMRKSETGSTTGQSFTFHTIQVEDVTGLFYLLLACFTICFVAALIEYMAFAISKSRCCRRHQRYR